MCKRALCALLLLFLLPIPALHADACDPLPPLQQYHIAACDLYSYASPDHAGQRAAIAKGTELRIESIYTDGFSHKWGQLHGNAGWVPMDALAPAYSPADYLSDHADSLRPYAGEVDPLLHVQEEQEEYLRWNSLPPGPDTLAPDSSMFEVRAITAWRYPGSPVCYPDVWTVAIVPLHALTDAYGATWVCAQHLANPDHLFWINADDPAADPTPDAPAIPPHELAAPTHLPVPGRAALYPIGRMTRLAPILPVLYALSGAALVSVILIALFVRKRRAHRV